MLRDRETDCCEEVCGEAQRGGAGAAQRTDTCGQTPGPAIDQGPHPVEGGQFGSRWTDGATAKSQQPSIPASTRLRGPANNWSKKASRLFWSASIPLPRPERASSTELPKPN